MVNSPLVKALFPGGVALAGVPLDSHDIIWANHSDLSMTC